MLVAEMWMEEVARAVGRPAHEVRALNMYAEGDATHYGQTLTHCRLGQCWSQARRGRARAPAVSRAAAYATSDAAGCGCCHAPLPVVPCF